MNSLNGRVILYVFSNRFDTDKIDSVYHTIIRL